MLRKSPPHDAELLELIFFHFIKECGLHFRGRGEGGQVGVICGGGGGGEITRTRSR